MIVTEATLVKMKRMKRIVADAIVIRPSTTVGMSATVKKCGPFRDRIAGQGRQLLNVMTVTETIADYEAVNNTVNDAQNVATPARIVLAMTDMAISDVVEGVRLGIGVV